MLLDNYRREMEQMGPSGAQMNALMDLIEKKEEPSMKKALPRTALIAAALCCAMVVTASAAALLGVFDHLKKQDNFAFLGMTEAYEEYAYDVNLTAATGQGDVFTLEKAAMDGAFCTIFYSYRYAEPIMTRAEFEALSSGDPLASWRFAPHLDLFLGETEISEEGYQNSIEVQQYLADEQTVYGAWRCILTASSGEVADGTLLTLQGYTYDYDAKEQRDFSLSFAAHLSSAIINDLDVTFPMNLGGTVQEVEAVSLHHSPLGTLLTFHHQRSMTNSLGILNSFVLRNKDTGEYIPFARIWTRSNSGGTDEVWDTFELFGDVSDLKTLELIPTWTTSSIAQRQVVSLKDLPCTHTDAGPGGYVPVSCSIGDDHIIVEMAPVGAVTANYPALGNGVRFLDKDGNDILKGSLTAKFKNRSTGVITVVTSFEEEKLAAEKDRLAAIWLFTDSYTLLEDRAVTIPIPLSLELD